MSRNSDKLSWCLRGIRSFQIVSNLWLIQNTVMLSIMPSIRHKGQHCGIPNPTGGITVAIIAGAISHLCVYFLPASALQGVLRSVTYTSLESCFMSVSPVPGALAGDFSNLSSRKLNTSVNRTLARVHYFRLAATCTSNQQH